MSDNLALSDVGYYALDKPPFRRKTPCPSPLPRPISPPSQRDLVDKARAYAEAASSPNTRRAYAADWAHFARWCRRAGLEALTPDPPTVGLYITACASGAPSVGGRANAVSTIERRLSALAWAYAQRGTPLDRRDRHIATVLAGIRNRHAAPPRQKEAILPDDLRAMLATCDPATLRGLRDRALLLIGFAGGLRRSEITGLDLARDQTADSTGWIDIRPEGVLLTLRGKTGWREVEIGVGSTPATCPAAALQLWLSHARLHHGAVFRRVSGATPGAVRLNDRAVARIVQRAALTAGLRGDLPEADRRALFAGHSLRAGLASSAEIDERHVQKQLGHSTAEMTRRYQRQKDRFKVNLTKAAGL